MVDKALRIVRAGAVSRPVMIAIAGDSAVGQDHHHPRPGAGSGPGHSRVDLRGRLPPLRPGRARATCRSRRCTPTATTSTSWSSTCSCWPPASRSSSPCTTTRTGAVLPARSASSRSEFVIVEGLLPLYSKLARACFDVTVYLDPPEEIRRRWKLHARHPQRGATRGRRCSPRSSRREPESEAYIRPAAQPRRHRGAVRADRRPRRPAGHAALGGAPAPADDPPPRPEQRAGRRTPRCT